MVGSSSRILGRGADALGTTVADTHWAYREGITPMNDDRLAEALDELAVRRLHHAYADIVTRREWAELHGVMRPTCTLDLDLGDRTMRFDGPAAIGEFIGTELRRFSFFEFVILNSVVRVDVAAGTAGARLYMQELRQNVDDGRRTDAYGVYHDHFERDADQRWWIARRRYGSFSRTAEPGSDVDQDVFPLPIFPLDQL